MKVCFAPNKNPVRIVATRLAKESPDEMFSTENLASALSISCEAAIRQLETLQDQDSIVRDFDDDLDDAPSCQTRWCLRHHSLIEGKTYEVLAMKYDDYRILNEPDQFSGPEPVLFHRDLFVITDPKPHPCWVCEIDEDGDAEYTLFTWRRTRFWEDFFDGVEEVVNRFFADLKRCFPETAKAYEVWKNVDSR